MIGLAIMAWLTVLICYGGNWVLGQCMIERPLVVGLVAGLLMGDVKTGVIIGASLEAIFMGAVNIGGAISAEPVTATALAVAFTVGAGIDQGAAITLAVPVGVVTAFLSIFMNNVFLAFFAATFDKMAAEGNEKGLALQHFVLWFVKYAAFGLIAFLIVAMGGFGSILGALFAAVLIVLVEALAGFYIAPVFKYVAVFGIYLAVIMVRPKGLFGW